MIEIHHFSTLWLDFHRFCHEKFIFLYFLGRWRLLWNCLWHCRDWGVLHKVSSNTNTKTVNTKWVRVQIQNCEQMQFADLVSLVAFWWNDTNPFPDQTLFHDNVKLHCARQVWTEVRDGVQGEMFHWIWARMYHRYVLNTIMNTYD